MAWAVTPDHGTYTITTHGPLTPAQARELAECLLNMVNSQPFSHGRRAEHPRVPDPQTEQNRIFEERIKALEDAAKAVDDRTQADASEPFDLVDTLLRILRPKP